MWVDAATAERLAQSTAYLATLVEMQFRSQTMRLFAGEGIVTAGGYEWRGLGDYGGVDNLSQARGLESQTVTFKLSGVSAEIVAAAKADIPDVTGRPIYVYAQVLDERFQPAAPLLPFWWGTMQRLYFTRSAATAAGGGRRVINLECKNLWAGRSVPVAGRWNDADQQYRHTGDNFFRFAGTQLNKPIRWPV